MMTGVLEGIELFVPGRLCLLGEHTDWAAGYRSVDPSIPRGHCLVAGTDQGLAATASPADRLELRTRLPDGRRVEASIGLDDLDEAAERADFFSYAAGTLRELRDRHDVGGVAVDIDSALPTRKGLSSSAAVSVLVARAASRVHGLELEPLDEMSIAYLGERRTGAECGRMDQVCAFGHVVTELTFDRDVVSVDLVPMGGEIDLLVVDLCAGKDTRRILADLNACFPDADDDVSVGVRRGLGPQALDLVAAARSAIERGDAASLGSIMTEAQELFDRDVAPVSTELTSPKLHHVLEHPAIAELGHGAKGVGSQGDGCAQIVCRDGVARDRLAAILERDLTVQTLPLTISP